MVVAYSHLKLLPTSILKIYRVFEHIHMLSICIWWQPYTVMAKDLGHWGHVWSRNHVMIGGPVQEFVPFVFFWWEPFSLKPFQIKMKTDRRATMRETIFDNSHQQIDCTHQLLHANQSYYSITSMSIANNS